MAGHMEREAGGKVLITGASRGIGRAMAELFARRGYCVYANYHKSEGAARDLAMLLAGEGHPITLVRGDISRAEDVAAMVEQAGSVDILINNAGIAQCRQFVDMTEADWDEMMAVNLKSVFLCVKAVIPHMLRRKRGKIINVSSVWGVAGGSCESHYSAAKAGVIGFTRALAKEFGPSGIRVNCIAPGVIDTDMIGDLTEADRRLICEQTPLGAIGLPADVAKAALFLAEDEFITGEVLNVNGWFYI